MPPFDRERVRQRGNTVAVIVFSALLGALYFLHGHLRWRMDEELLASILAVAWLFSLTLFDPIATRYASFETRRYCSKHGHLLEEKIAADGRPYVICNRCDMVMVNEQVSTNVKRT